MKKVLSTIMPCCMALVLLTVSCKHEIPASSGIVTPVPNTPGTGGGGTTAACDTANFKYSTAVEPLLKRSCISCHNASNPGGGIDLSTFTLAQAFAKNGRLFGSINHSAGYKPMPQGAAKFTVCEITQIKKWIDAGALNDLAGTGGGTTPITPVINLTPCSTDTVYFQNTIQPLIASGCTTSGCHDAITKASGVDLTSYTKIMGYVNVGNASNSKLYKVLVKTGNEKMPLPPLPAFTATQITQVQNWINQGAKNNVCNGCDTTKFSYAAAIQPIMQTSCIGCHSTASPGGGIDLSTYAQMKIYAANGRLFGSINHTPGYSAMPKGIPQMPACQILQIKKWIDAGAPNN
ncbi:MAG: hypothetical protein Q8K64_14880 [Sediminibacterium sp.]|nr:hypothetical protein [Sediminibacterium sp.]